MITAWLAVAGGVGAVARFIADGLLRTVFGRKFPYATLIINVVGSFILGVVAGLVLYQHTSTDIKLIVGTGFCGGFTTFSTASFEAVRLIEERRFVAVVVQVAGTVGLSFGAAALGLWLVH